jgi:hypothetical protein
LNPVLTDEHGTPRASLPKGGRDDDPALAAEAATAWRRIRRELRELVPLQSRRLEQAMVTGRRWTLEEFERVLAGHPVLRHLVRALVWGAWDGGRHPVTTFRVTDEGDLADRADHPVRLDRGVLAGVVHPIQLGTHRAAWAGIAEDYQLVQPFPQLGRAAWAIPEADRDQRAISAFASIEVPAATLVTTLERRGWRPGSPVSGGRITEHIRKFPAEGVSAIASYEELDPALLHQERARSVRRVHFRTGSWGGPPMRLGDVPAIPASEVLRDLNDLAEQR